MSNTNQADDNLSQEAARLMRQVLDGPIRLERIPIGVMTQKFAVTDVAGARYILRIYPEYRSDVVRYEPDLLRRCRDAGTRVAEVIADSRTGPATSFSYMIYRMVPGERLTLHLPALTASAKDRLAREIAEQLELMAGITMTGYGDLQDSHTSKRASWRGFLEDAFRQGIAAVQRLALLPLDLIERLQKVEGCSDSFPVSPAPGLVWSDVSTDNILVDSDGRLMGLIDFESCLAGDPLLCLGYCAALYGRGGLTQLLTSAWRPPLGLAENAWMDLYAVVRVLRIAPYHANKFLPCGAAFAPLLQTFTGFEAALRRLT